MRGSRLDVSGIALSAVFPFPPHLSGYTDASLYMPKCCATPGGFPPPSVPQLRVRAYLPLIAALGVLWV